MKNLLHYPVWFLIAAFINISSCGNNDNETKADITSDQTTSASTVTDKAGYDLDNPVRAEMKKKLKEISGIHYIKDEIFAAIQDESGKIFLVNFSNSEIVEELSFAGKGDYEDVTLDNSYYYVLESSGKIYRVPRKGDVSQVKVFTLSMKKNAEFESVYLDQTGENLIMVCKNCPGKKGKEFKNAYSFNLKTEAFREDPLFSIDMGTIPGISTAGKLDIKPSATAIQPKEKKLYVLCSAGKLLLKCDLQGKVERWWPLNPEIYKQPEGIAFTPNGDMYISNEAVDDDKGNILKLQYK